MLGAVGGRPSRLVCAWIGVLGVVFALLTATSVARACSAGMSWLGGYYRRAADCWRPLALVLGLAVYVELLLVAGRLVGFRPGSLHYGAVPWKVDIGRRGWELLQTSLGSGRGAAGVG